MMEIIKDVAAVVGCILSCVSLATIIFKPIRKAFVNAVANIADTSEEKEFRDEILKEISSLHNKVDQMQVQVNQINNNEQKSEKALTDMIRERIVEIYYANLNTKKLHYEEWETINALFDSYSTFHGNSFVKGLIDQMSHWEITQ